MKFFDHLEESSLVEGPWLSAFYVQVPLSAVSKSNFKMSGKGSKGPSWSKYSSFENDLATLVAPHVPSDWPLGDPDEKLETRPIVVALMFADTLLDAGNLPKSIQDAFEGLLYYNDASVRSSLPLARKRSSAKDSSMFLAFAALDASSDYRDWLLALENLVKLTK